MGNVVDSSGWIEFFLAGANGLIFKAVIEDSAHLYVPTIALFEVHRVLSRRLPSHVVDTCLGVMRLANVLDVTAQRAIVGAEVAARHQLAMADALMYSMALEMGATFWTQDVDYEGLPGVKYFVKA